MSGSTMRLENCTRLNVATASVMEWARVKQVMILSEEAKLRETINRPKRKSKWSYPVQICFTPMRRKSAKEEVEASEPAPFEEVGELWVSACGAGYSDCGSMGLCSPVVAASERAAGKPPEPAGWKACPTRD